MDSRKPSKETSSEGLEIRKTSIAELKKQMFENHGQAETTNQQKTIVQKDLENLRGRSITENRPQFVASTIAEKKIAQETPKVRLATLKSQLFSQPGITQKNTQKEETEKEVKRLQENEGNVRQKAELLRQYFLRSDQILAGLKHNTVSKIAKEKLKQETEFEHFNNQQNKFINDVKIKVDEDIERYANSPDLQKQAKSFGEFLKLSFTYRLYEVCLEKDFLRHIAKRLSSVNESADAPTQLAVESLNYYRDFFLYLSKIEKIWPNAGIDIRKAEINIAFAAVAYNNMSILKKLLGEKTDEAYLENLPIYTDALDDHIAKWAFLKEYILAGDGLEENHPWKKYNCARLPQPNTPIDFGNILPCDATHANAIEEVNTRVEADQRLRMM